jgi:hypothetical protein
MVRSGHASAHPLPRLGHGLPVSVRRRNTYSEGCGGGWGHACEGGGRGGACTTLGTPHCARPCHWQCQCSDGGQYQNSAVGKNMALRAANTGHPSANSDARAPDGRARAGARAARAGVGVSGKGQPEGKATPRSTSPQHPEQARCVGSATRPACSKVSAIAKHIGWFTARGRWGFWSAGHIHTPCDNNNNKKRLRRDAPGCCSRGA